MDEVFIYALDFDGVICDSAVETGITGWKAAGTIWNDMPKSVPDGLIDLFRQARPIIETGYEAVLAMRLLFQGETVETIYHDFANKSSAVMQSASISVDDLKAVFGNTRDHWIAEDIDDWVGMNPLFTGVAEKLKLLSNNAELQPWYIVTTKQERFVKQILKANSIGIAGDNVFGLDRKMNKIAVLSALQVRHPGQTVYFVEDRVQTLVNVANSADLNRVKTVFALWGYNTAEDKALAQKYRFTLQQLENFLE